MLCGCSWYGIVSNAIASWLWSFRMGSNLIMGLHMPVDMHVEHVNPIRNKETQAQTLGALHTVWLVAGCK